MNEYNQQMFALECIDKYGGRTAEDIAIEDVHEATDAPRSLIHLIVQTYLLLHEETPELAAQGLVERDGGGVVSITDKGLMALERVDK